MQLFPLSERIPDLKDTPCVRQSHDIPRPRLVDGRLTLRHELRGRGEAHRLALTDMQIRLVALELPTAHLTERDTRAMIRVDIRCDLEDKARELLLLRFHLTFLRLRWPRTGRNLHEAIQQFLHTEVVQCRAKEHRRHLCSAIRLHIELRVDPIHQFEVLTQFSGIILPHPTVEVSAIDINLHLIRDPLFIRREEVQFLFVDVVHPLELRALVDGP